jgi:hypothetical protein
VNTQFEHGYDLVVNIFAEIGGQLSYYGSMLLHHPLIFPDIRPKIIDALLTAFLGHRDDIFESVFHLKSS